MLERKRAPSPGADGDKSSGITTSPRQQLTLEGLLSRHAGREWYFVNPGGNWGDQLIYEGAHFLADRLGLRRQDFDFRNFDPTAIPTGAAIYLHGSGGFNPWGSKRAFRILAQALSVRDALVVQGPQSCSTTTPETEALLAESLRDSRASEIHLLARERATERFLAERLPAHVHLHIDHDTAFQLPVNRLLELAQVSHFGKGRYRLIAAREDNEAPALPPQIHGRAVQLDPATYAISFRHWLRIHAQATSITSNRLHSAILGSLLGKPVTLLPGSYHKNRSVWEHSLRQRGVNWSDGFAPIASVTTRRHWLPRWLRQSWKFERAVKRLQGVPLN